MADEIARRTAYIADVKGQMDLIKPNLTVDPNTTDADLIKATAEAVTAIGNAQIAEQQARVDELTKTLADRQLELDARLALGYERIAIEELQFQSTPSMNYAYVNEMIWNVWTERQMIILSDY